MFNISVIEDHVPQAIQFPFLIVFTLQVEMPLLEGSVKGNTTD